MNQAVYAKSLGGKVPRIGRFLQHHADAAAAPYGLCRAPSLLTNQPEQGLASRCAKLLRVERIVCIRVGRFEALLDEGQVFPPGQLAVVVRICLRKSACRHPASEFLTSPLKKLVFGRRSLVEG